MPDTMAHCLKDRNDFRAEQGVRDLQSSATNTWPWKANSYVVTMAMVMLIVAAVFASILSHRVLAAQHELVYFKTRKGVILRLK